MLGSTVSVLPFVVGWRRVVEGGLGIRAYGFQLQEFEFRVRV